MEDCSCEGILYTATCQKCEGTPSVYIGDPSRTLYVRGNQHRSDFARMKRAVGPNNNVRDKLSSFIMDHQEEFHGDDGVDQVADIKFTLLSKHRDLMDRQIMEAVHIKQALEKNILLDRKNKEVHINSMNRKLKYFAPRVIFVKE